jgi:phenylalanyl-tRNA synthetase beta chain
MNLSYNWLAEYIDLSGYTPGELAEKLTMAGIEVEAMEESALVPEGVVVAKILEREPHPDADKLSVCKVFDGKDNLQIVCGAPNCDAGKTVPLATIGTVFINADGSEFKIKKGKLRGVESMGMLCSSDELGLDGDHSGLLELEDKLEAGTPLKQVFAGDVAYELEITPNRPDWLSHWGVARDLACLIKREAKMPESGELKATAANAPAGLVSVEAPDLCPRYTARVIRNVKVQDSPEWLKERLLSIGLRPINNIVDITNFVLHELGHPLHAFDLDKLAEQKIIVRSAAEGEKFTALDGSELELAEKHLVIADAEKAVALAGVMGGLDSGVTEETVNILLESATFQPSGIRSTSRELNMRSDSSYRFERGTDWDMVETASDRATYLILQLAGGELVTPLVDVNTGRPRFEKVICRFDRIRSLIGADIDNEEILRILSSLRLEVSELNEQQCYVTPPLFRLDIEREADLAEEVARIHGLDAIPVPPVKSVLGGMRKDDSYYKNQELRDQLIALGLYECTHYSMVSEESALKDTAFSGDDLVRIGNPLSLELACMRPSLTGEMLATVERNISRQNTDLKLFELGRVFCANKDMYPEERHELCLVLSGRKHPERFSAERSELYDFYDLKGMIESLFEQRRVQSFSFRKGKDGKFDYCAEIIVNGRVCGHAGLVNKAYTKGFKTKNPVFMAVIQADMLMNMKAPKTLLQQLSQFPSTTRDVAFVAPDTLLHSEVMDFIAKAKLKFLEKVELFDIFRDDSLGSGKKSMAYTLTFRNPERTLTDKEVNSSFDKLRENLAKNLGVELR